MTTPTNWRSVARARLVRFKSEAESHRAESQRLTATIVSMVQHLRREEIELAELERRLPFLSGDPAAKMAQEVEERRADLDAQRAALTSARERHEETKNAFGLNQRLVEHAITAALRVGIVTPEEAAA